MARKYHPDKNPNNKKAASKFVEIAEAYEILSNTDQRREYDTRRVEASRSSGERRKHKPTPSRDYNENMREEPERPAPPQFQQNGFEFDPNSRQTRDVPVFTPSFTDDIIFPYYPIMISPERTFFALLDKTCAFKVYEGSYDELLQFAYTQSIELLDENFSLLYKTPERSSLNGKCFAGVDEIGLLHIYRGHPSQRSAKEIWISSLKNTNTDPMDSYYRRYFLTLSNIGELAVNYITSQSFDRICVWSTSSCSAELAIINLQKMIIIKELKNILINFKDYFSIVEEVFYTAKEKNLLQLYSSKINRAINGFARMTRPYWDRKYAKVREQRNAQRNRRERQYRR
eukprot:gene2227-4326_t